MKSQTVDDAIKLLEWRLDQLRLKIKKLNAEEKEHELYEEAIEELRTCIDLLKGKWTKEDL